MFALGPTNQDETQFIEPLLAVVVSCPTGEFSTQHIDLQKAHRHVYGAGEGLGCAYCRQNYGNARSLERICAVISAGRL